MKTITLVCGLLLGLSFSTPLFSQKVIALHHAGAVSYFTDLSAAYNAAADGDTLYLPGGSFNGFTLQKSLTIIGVGHHPDSTAATGPTVFSNSFNFSFGANNSIITGIYFLNQIYCNYPVLNVVISRCYLGGGLRFSLTSNSILNWVISENWIGADASNSSIGSSYSTSNMALRNNVVRGEVRGPSSSEIRNNIFLSAIFADNSTFSNNIFIEGYPWTNNSANSQWYNNLNAGVNGGPSGAGVTGSGNYLDNPALSSVFANYSPSNTFYQNDFHVVNPAYLGNDGTPVGIYGGPFPWKDGSLPFTPHIRSKTIGATTNPDGTLKINITVKAQNN